MARTLLLLGFCSLALAQNATVTTPSSVDWRFAQPDADLKMTINIRALMDSPGVAKAIEQAKSQAKGDAIQMDLALGILRTVDRVSVSARQKTAPKAKVVAGAVAGAAAANPASNMDVVAEVTGSFDSSLIEGFFPSMGTNKVKVVGPHTVLIGEGASFEQAQARMAGAASPVSRDELDQSDFWMSVGSNFIQQQAGTSPAAMPPVLQGLRGISMGFNLSDSPELNILLTAKDAAGAGELLKAMQAGIGPLGQASPEAAAAAKALNMKQDGSKVRVHFVVPQELMAMAQQQVASGGAQAQLAPLLASFGLGGTQPATPAQQPPAQPGMIRPVPPPQNGGKIVIYGLDSGTKEIPAK